MANKYTIKVRGKTVTFRELGVVEFEAVLRTKTDGGGTGEGWEITQEGLRRSIVEIDGKPVTYADLAGEKLAERFPTREMLVLRNAWDSVHMPSAEDMASVGNMMVVVEG